MNGLARSGNASADAGRDSGVDRRAVADRNGNGAGSGDFRTADTR